MQSIAISLYFDQKMNVYINPILRKPSGVGIGSGDVIILKNGYTNEMLADAILKALELSRINDIDYNPQTNFWKDIIGKKGFTYFSKQHKCVTVI